MAKIHTIDVHQLTLLMVVGGFFELLSFSPTGWGIETAMVTLVGDIFGAIIALIVMIPIFKLLKPNNDNVISATYRYSPKLGVVASVAYWAYFLYVTIDVVAHLHFFITSSVYPTAPAMLFLIIFCLVIAYFVYMGIEAIARSNWIFFLLILVGVVTVDLVLIPKMRLVNCVTPFLNGVMPVAKSSFNFFARNVGTLMLLIMASNVNGSIVKTYLAYTGIITFLGVITVFYAITTLGDYGGTKPFPIYTTTSVAETGIIRRWDSIFIYIWILCALIKAAVYVYLACVCMGKFVIRKNKLVYISANTVIVFIFSLVLVSNVKYFEMSYNFLNSGISQTLFIYLFPILVFVLMKFKKRKGKTA